MYGAQPWGSSGPYGKAQYVTGHFGSGGSTLPSGLLALYRSTDSLRTVKGGITWDGTPTIGADGVEPGYGPSFGTLTRGNGRVFCAKVKMDKASDGLTGDEHILGPLYARSGYLVAKVDGSEDTVAATWAAGATLAIRADVVTGGLAVEILS